MDPVGKILSGKQRGYFDSWPVGKGTKTVVSGLPNRGVGQGENVEVLDYKGKLIKVKSLEFGDTFLVEALN